MSTGNPAGDVLEIRILGTIEIVRDTEEIPLAPKQRSLLALLLLERGRVVSNDRIADALWGDQLPTVVGDAIRFHASRLRRALATNELLDLDLHADHGGYRLTVNETVIDAVRFERLVDAALRALTESPDIALADCERALSMWRGPPLGDVTYEQFASLEIRRLEQLHLRAHELRIDALTRLGRLEEAAEAIGGLVVEYPIHHGFAESLLRVLNRLGRPIDALREYEESKARFRQELGIRAPEVLRGLAAESRALIEDPAWTDPEHRRLNIPLPLSRYVDRGTEVDDLQRRLEEHRLVTLVGPGGVGKTRLAVEAARGLAASFADGAWLVDLLEIDEDASVPGAVARALDIGEGSSGTTIRRLVSKLSSNQTLVVLDNCEHVGGGAATVTEQLLGVCPRLRILATSRVRLGIQGESVFQVEPLKVPDPAATPRQIMDASSVRLFTNRASSAAGYSLIEDDMEAVAALMVRLAGLPLAIEMAAARAQMLHPAEITANLNSHLDYLQSGERGIPPHHRSLAATFRWSYDLLGRRERDVFRRLAVLQPGWKTEAAAAVAGCDTDPGFVDVLGELVDASLVVRDGDRFRLLEPIREMALSLLHEAEEQDETYRRYVEFYGDLAHKQRAREGRVFEHGVSPEPPDDHFRVVDAVRGELGNYRSAFRRAVQNLDQRTALEISAAISPHLSHRAAPQESAALLREALDMAGDAPDELVTDALLCLAVDDTELGQIEDAEQSTRRAAEISDRIGYVMGKGDAHAVLAIIAFERGDLRLVRSEIEEAIRIRRAENVVWLASSMVLVCLLTGDVATAEANISIVEQSSLDEVEAAFLLRLKGIAASARGDFAEALHLFQTSVEDCNVERLEIEGLRFVAHAHLNVGDVERAGALAEYLLERSRESGVRGWIDKIENLAGLAAVRSGRPKEGAELIANALARSYDRGDRYLSWRFLYSGGEALIALGDVNGAKLLLCLADEIADVNQYWLPAIEWAPLIDRAVLGAEDSGHTSHRSVDLASAVEIVRTADGHGPSFKGDSRGM